MLLLAITDSPAHCDHFRFNDVASMLSLVSIAVNCFIGDEEGVHTAHDFHHGYYYIMITIKVGR